MILKHNVVKSDFISEVKGGKLYCYGAGKVFADFLLVYPWVNVCAVVDRKLSEINQCKTESGIPIISIDDFINECDKDSCLVITCFDYQEVEKELEKIEALNEVNCYVYCLMQGLFDVKDDRETSNKYQITEFKLQDYCAGQKAPSDVAVIAGKAGYKILSVNRGTLRFGLSQTEAEWKRIVNSITDSAIVLIQLPMVDWTNGVKHLLDIKYTKHVKIIGVIHDIDGLRGEKSKYADDQYDILKALPDIWIVHNQHMADELEKKGFNRDRMVSLNIFDYLIDDFEKAGYKDGIIIAGNLDRQKSGFIYDLHMIEGISFNLFGANYDAKEDYSNINYYGAFLPDELIKAMEGRYGLVWDGDSVETCSGEKGEYLRFNNPHKLSLYLSVGLPVIIWNEAAEADFVRRENVGITVRSLYELPEKLSNISEKDYEIMKNNATVVGERLRKGEYMTNAIKEAENRIKEIETETIEVHCLREE